MTTFIGAPQSPRHGQYVIDGQKYPRVSTILGVISKPGLEAWRQRIGVDEANRISQDAADFGTRFHAACEAIDRDWHGYDRTRVDADLRALVQAYCAWATDTVSEVYAIEQVLHHARHRFAGTVDRVFRLRDNRLVIADFKTGRTVDGIYRLQLMAYQEAWESMNYGSINGRVVLHLPRERNGHLAVIEYDDEERDRKAWRSCLRLWRWWQRHQHDYRRTQ